MPASAFESARATRLPIFTLSDEVHFPRTVIQLRIVEPGFCDLVEDLFLNERVEGRIGTVLRKPEWVQEGASDHLFTAGTAGRLIGFDHADDGCDVLLRGEYRFVIESQIGDGPCREAVVRRVVEPALNEQDPSIREVRNELIECTSNLSYELGNSFPLDPEQLGELDDELSFEEVVNLLAANLDLTPLRKQQLLSDTLPDRALHLLSILRSRCEVIDVLRPYRHLAEEFTQN
jgi:Lon protease-like protein